MPRERGEITDGKEKGGGDSFSFPRTTSHPFTTKRKELAPYLSRLPWSAGAAHEHIYGGGGKGEDPPKRREPLLTSLGKKGYVPKKEGGAFMAEKGERGGGGYNTSTVRQP